MNLLREQKSIDKNFPVGDREGDPSNGASSESFASQLNPPLNEPSSSSSSPG